MNAIGVLLSAFGMACTWFGFTSNVRGAVGAGGFVLLLLSLALLIDVGDRTKADT